MITVTGLHDMDEFVQSQLILAVSSACSFTSNLQHSEDKHQLIMLTLGVSASVAMLNSHLTSGECLSYCVVARLFESCYSYISLNCQDFSS